MSTARGNHPATAVFRAMTEDGIPYCLWRGTPRLERAFAGESDFDVLVDARHSGRLACLFGRLGVVRARTDTRYSAAGLEDWFGLGGPCGPLLHYHIHYRLVAGEPRQNRFRLPWEHQVLASRQPLRDHGLLVADPVVESALLLVRCALNLRMRDRIPWSAAARRLVLKVNADLAVLLRERRTSDLISLLEQWLATDLGWLSASGLPGLDARGLRRLRRRIEQALPYHASERGLHAAIKAWGLEIRSGLRIFARRWRLPMFPYRGGCGGGLLVVIAGGEGARVAGLAKDLCSVFAGKFDVLRARAGRCQRRRAKLASNRGMLAICSLGSEPWRESFPPDLVLDLRSASDSAGRFEALGRGACFGIQQVAMDRVDAEVLADLVEAIWSRL